MWFAIVIGFLASYLLGNLNGAVSVSAMMNDDVRSHGSGNAGLTNFMRNYGKAKSVLVLLIDVVKTVLACFLGKLLLQPYGYDLEGMMVCAIGVSLGHDFPVLLGFRGGKGVLSGVSVALAVDYRCAIIILTAFFICLVFTKYVSLSSIVGALGFSAFFAIVYWHRPFVMIAGVFLGLLVVFMHRGNIARLIHGTERKIGQKKKAK